MFKDAFMMHLMCCVHLISLTKEEAKSSFVEVLMCQEAESMYLDPIRPKTHISMKTMSCWHRKD